MLCSGLACQAFENYEAGVAVQPHHTRCTALVEVDEIAARAEEVAEWLEAQRLLAE